MRNGDVSPVEKYAYPQGPKNRAALPMGEVQGVIPEHVMAREVGRKGLTKFHVVRSMHERKALMADLSDAFVAMPGGFGTVEEFCEAVTWTQLGLHAEPCGIFECAGVLLAAAGDV